MPNERYVNQHVCVLILIFVFSIFPVTCFITLFADWTFRYFIYRRIQDEGDSMTNRLYVNLYRCWISVIMFLSFASLFPGNFVCQIGGLESLRLLVVGYTFLDYLKLRHNGHFII